MALTVTGKKWMSLGNKLACSMDVAFDDSYPTGGEDFDPVKVPGIRPVFISISPRSGYVFEYDETNKKILAYSTAATEVGNGTDLSTLTGVKVLVIGT
jgi:hypothetical protein